VAAAEGREWKLVRSTHFLVHYADNLQFAEEVSRKAEEYYGAITADLGYTRYDNFWLWENRVKIMIYPGRAEFIAEAGAPEWAIGKASYKKREISTYDGGTAFLDSVLPHEMTHLIFREFVGFKGEVPLWLHEGVAQWEEERGKKTEYRRMMRRLADANALIPLDRLTRMDIKAVDAEGKAAQFYAQSGSLVGYMIAELGSGKFRTFCGQVRDGKGVEDALRFAYPGTLGNIKDLETQWTGFVMKWKEANQ
jgi:hypothetical protein